MSDLEKDLFSEIIQTHFDFKTILNDHNKYSAFVTLFVKSAMLLHDWRKLNVNNFEQTLTTHAEAFCLSCLSNGFERWRAECNARLAKRPDYPEALLLKCKLPKHEEDALPRWKFTCHIVNSKLRSGWTAEGKEYFLNMFDLCTQARNSSDKNIKYALAIANIPSSERAKPAQLIDLNEEEARKAEISARMKRTYTTAFAS